MTKREWASFENGGQKIFGVLHLPEGEEKAPVVIILHGFASHKVGTNRSYVIMSEALAKEGIATLRFDFRGNGDSEGDFAEMTFSGLVTDALAALHFVANDPRLDCDRIGLFGSSLGGAAGVVAASEYEKVKSLALWAPVASGLLWYRDWLVQNPEKGSADPSLALASYRGVKVNPLFQSEFAKLDAPKTLQALDHLPLLHIHSEKDAHISLLHQKAYVESRKDAKGASRFLTFPDSEHMLGRSPFFPKVVEEAISWFKTHL